jgi:cytochrome c2
MVGTMKKALIVVGAVVGALVILVGGFMTYVAVSGIPRYEPGKVELRVDITPEKVTRGRKLASMLCADCHLDPSTRQLTGKRMLGADEFGVLYSKNITQHPVQGIGKWTDGELAYLLRTGIDRKGQYIPPYMVKLPHLSDDDLESIIAFMRSNDPLVAAVGVDPPGVTQPSFLTKLLSHFAFKPLPYPRTRVVAPPETDKVAYGRYLSWSLGCFSCHSGDFKKMDDLEPEKSFGYMGGGNMLRDQNNDVVFTSNITFDQETGIGKWTEADFTRALRTGVRPDRRVLGDPMSPLPELTESDTTAIYAYLKTVPILKHAIPPAQRKALVGDASEGKKIYYRLGCLSCHGESGVGLADLRHATERYPQDDQLKAWIRNAPLIKPGTRMPTWDGVIQENEYAPLIAYVKELGKESK